MSDGDLNDLYSKAVKLIKDAESMPRGDARQEAYDLSRRLFEEASSVVEKAGLFSENEIVDDIPTAHLKYLLIPAYLAKIAISKECGPDRLKTFRTAENLIKAFLDRLSSYGLVDRNICDDFKPVEPQAYKSQPQDLRSAMQSRTEKIERFKRLKLLESHLDELEKQINSEQQVDEEMLREFYLDSIKKWTYDTLDRLEGEVRPALLFELNRFDGAAQPVPPAREASKAKLGQPFTIVETDLQKKVYGIGYPSRPTVTVDEFINSKMASGELAFQTQKEVYANSLQRYAEVPNLRRQQEEESDEEKDAKEERDDPIELEKKRNWDDYKDENPRGAGNRYNMG